jgi:hypothetical protein
MRPYRDSLRGRSRLGAALLIIAAGGGTGISAGPTGPDVAADLRPETVEAFQRHLQSVEARIDERVAGKRDFLWVDGSLSRQARVRQGQVVVERADSDGPVEVPDGLIHDFIGAVFIPGVTLEQTIRFVQDYDRHEDFYGPEVIESRIVSRDGNHFTLFMRLKKKKVITVVLDTRHDATFFPLDRTRWHSRSATTSIAEVEDPGTPREHALPPSTGHGFMWTLNSYWRFLERNDGVYVECQAVSLSRGIPWGLGWLIGPIVNDLPKESLANTLSSTRAGLLGANRTR